MMGCFIKDTLRYIPPPLHTCSPVFLKFDVTSFLSKFALFGGSPGIPSFVYGGKNWLRDFVFKSRNWSRIEIPCFFLLSGFSLL